MDDATDVEPAVLNQAFHRGLELPIFRHTFHFAVSACLSLQNPDECRRNNAL